MRVLALFSLSLACAACGSSSSADNAVVPFGTAGASAIGGAGPAAGAGGASGGSHAGGGAGGTSATAGFPGTGAGGHAGASVGGTAGASGASANGGTSSGTGGASSGAGGAFPAIPGVHVPLPIDPDVDIPDNHWLLDAYRTVLGREHDVSGYVTNFDALQAGASRASIVSAFVKSPEFSANGGALSDKSGFVGRVYQTLLLRAPTAAETSSQIGTLASADGTGGGTSWNDFLAGIYASAEYKQKNCETGYYTLGAQVNEGALLLHDLFDGTARLQTIPEAEPLNVPAMAAPDASKIPLVKDPHGDEYVGFTRIMVSQGVYNVFLVTSQDGVTFDLGGAVYHQPGTFYDPHLAMDHGVCPTRYVMATECLGTNSTASLCASQSTTPAWVETWTHAANLIDGEATNIAKSASTGVTLIDGKTRYAAWTQVYDYANPSPPDGHVLSLGKGVATFDALAGTTSSGVTLLSSEATPYCTDAWDCDNRDKQDWKREGDLYYLLYNGANYYGGGGVWGISVARSTAAAAGEYLDRMPIERGIPALASTLPNHIGVSYPFLNVIGGEPFVYFAAQDPTTGANLNKRARLVPNTTTCSGASCGYFLAGANGAVFAAGDATYEGGANSSPLSKPVVGMAATPSGKGYWLAASDGGVFAFGDAPFQGSLPGMMVNVSNIVGIAASPDGMGYLLTGTDGGIFAFGSAGFHGSLPGMNVSVSNVVGIAMAPDGGGYWLTGRDGGIFAFGDAPYLGSLPSQMVAVNDIVGITATPDGKGYWLVGADGGVFSFGSAAFHGSLSGSSGVVGIASTPTGGGYWVFEGNGAAHGFGDAASLASATQAVVGGCATKM
jgi:hypothetical protein